MRPERPPLLGILNVSKPVGCSSHDVVAFLRSLLPRKTRVGHGGALDPLAEGVLPLCVGKATRLSSYFLEGEKIYRVRSRLDLRTDSQDVTGSTVETFPAPESMPDDDRIGSLCRGFLGEQEQTVPRYSAVHVDGRRLYDLARKGIDVELPIRKIHVYELKLEAWDWPFMDWTVRCSKGTYVRQLAEDLGARLGLGGCVVRLLRLQAGNLRLETALRPVDLLGAAFRGELSRHFQPWETLFPQLGRAWLRPEGLARIRVGAAVGRDDLLPYVQGSSDEVLLFLEDRLVALCRCEAGSDGRLQPKKVFWEEGGDGR